MTRFSFLAALIVACAAGCSRARPTPAGLWDATVTVRGVEVPFKFEIAEQGSAYAGWFFDGDVKVPSTSGQFADGKLSLSFAQYGSRVDATLKDDRLEGRYDRGTRGPAYDLKATRTTAPPPAGTFPSLSGEWRIPIEEGTGSNKGEASWRFLLTQNGPDVKGAIMRVDGDSGTLTGRFADGHLVLSHFSGARPARLDVTPQPDGTLALIEDGKYHRIAM